MNLLEVMQKRRSIRKYKEEEIPKEMIEKILQAGLLSASGKNVRPWEFIVVEKREDLDYIAKARTGNSAKMLEHAKCAILVLADSGKTDVWIEDACVAMTNMHLMASYLGLGSCWIQGRGRMANDKESTEELLRKKFSFPEEIKLEAILSLGLPAETKKSRSLESLEQEKIHWGSY